MQSWPIDLASLDAPGLTHLAYYAPPHRAAGVSNHLGLGDIITISCFKHLKILELHNWTTWDDLSPLKEKALEELVSTAAGLLSDFSNGILASQPV